MKRAKNVIDIETKLEIGTVVIASDIHIPFQDDASIENAIHCLMVLLHLGYDRVTIEHRMYLLYPVEMRLKVKDGINSTTIIDDSYSSDFQSLKIALDFLESQKQYKKKTVILSDIFQSGLSNEELYSKVSQLVISNKINRVIGIGTTITAFKHKFVNCITYPTTADFLAQLDKWGNTVNDQIFFFRHKMAGTKMVGCYDYCLNHAGITKENVKALREQNAPSWIDRYTASQRRSN